MELDASGILAEYEIVDLSVTVDPEFPSGGSSEPRIEVLTTSIHEDSSGFFSRRIALDEHTGTHFDAPAHVVPRPDSGLRHASDMGLVTTEHVGLNELIRPAIVIDCRQLTDQADLGESPIIGPDFIEQWEVANGALSHEECVIFYTGFNDRLYRSWSDGGDEYYSSRENPPRSVGWPAPNVETLVFLADRGVKLLGIDGPVMGRCEGSYNDHVAGLARGVCYIEKLCAVGQLPVRGALFMFLPVKLRGGSGAFGRAVGFVPRGATRIGDA